MRFPILHTTTKKAYVEAIRALYRAGYLYQGLSMTRATRYLTGFVGSSCWISAVKDDNYYDIHVWDSYVDALDSRYPFCRMNSLDHMADFIKIKGLIAPTP